MSTTWYLCFFNLVFNNYCFNFIIININNIFSTVDKIAKEPNSRKTIDEGLLGEDYRKILEYLKGREERKLLSTMKDIKKHLNVTHPTIVAKLRYLEEKEFIEIKKKGRDKNIYLK